MRGNRNTVHATAVITGGPPAPKCRRRAARGKPWPRVQARQGSCLVWTQGARCRVAGSLASDTGWGWSSFPFFQRIESYYHSNQSSFNNTRRRVRMLFFPSLRFGHTVEPLYRERFLSKMRAASVAPTTQLLRPTRYRPRVAHACGRLSPPTATAPAAATFGESRSPGWRRQPAAAAGKWTALPEQINSSPRGCRERSQIRNRRTKSKPHVVCAPAAP